jgi:hypothetical protein
MIPNPSNFVNVLKSPSVWTGKGGISKAADLLSNSSLQDKIQFGLMKSSFDTMIKTGDIVIPGAKEKNPVGQLYNAAANAGKNLISPSAGLTTVPQGLGGMNLNSLSSITGALPSIPGALSGITGAVAGVTGAVAGATGALSSITGSLPGIPGALSGATGLVNKGSAELGGLLANASKFGVSTATAWAKGSPLTGTITGALSSATSALSGTTGIASAIPNSLKTQMNSLAKQGQFAVNFSDAKLPAIATGVVPAPSFKGTVDRSTLNAAFGKLVGSDKIPLPAFSPQAVDNSMLTTAANKAKSILTTGLNSSGLPSIGSLASLGSGITNSNNLAQAATAISNRLRG